jgi:hypothetical protein
MPRKYQVVALGRGRAGAGAAIQGKSTILMHHFVYRDVRR